MMEEESFSISKTSSSDLFEIVKDLNLDWMVAGVPVISDPKTLEWGGIKFRENIGIIRCDTKRPLGVMGDKYKIIQNIEALEVLKNLVDEKKIKINLGGFFKYGKRAWISANHKDLNIGDFEAIGNMMLVWSHNGDLALSSKFVPELYIQKVGNITLPCFVPGKTDTHGRYSIKHTENASEKMEAAYKDAESFFDKVETYYNGLIEEPFSLSRVEAILEYLYPNPLEPKIKKDETPVISYNEKRRESIMRDCYIFYLNYPFTKFWAVIGFDYYCDNNLPIRKTKGTAEQEQRQMSIWFGLAHEEKIRFIKALHDYDKLVEQGKINKTD